VAARCTHHTCDVAGGLPQVDWAEGRAPPEAVQLLGEPKGHPQVLQPLCGTVRQVDQQRWQPRPRLQLLCQESATCGRGGGERGPRYWVVVVAWGRDDASIVKERRGVGFWLQWLLGQRSASIMMFVGQALW
jgi:hypothetical protein